MGLSALFRLNHFVLLTGYKNRPADAEVAGSPFPA